MTPPNLVTCPCCRASNAAGLSCRRCKADLSLVAAVDRQRADRLREARRALNRSEPDEALELLDEAAWLRAGDDVDRLRAAALLLAGDFPAALAAYHAVSRSRADA